MLPACKMPSYQRFLSRMHFVAQRNSDINLEVTKQLRYEHKSSTYNYDSVKISSRHINPNDPVMLIRAGIHGDEIFGPLTLYRHLPEIFNYAHSKGVKLVIFPLDNPSGYEAGTRYNICNDRGDAGNNDFLRYKLRNGEMVDDLVKGTDFAEWYWSSDEIIDAVLPQETINLHRELGRLPLPQVEALLDLHADNFIHGAYAYHYAFGDLLAYEPIVSGIEKCLPILKNTNVDSGYLNAPGYVPAKVTEGAVIPDDFKPKTDHLGTIVRHDGSLGDLFHRLGTPHSITVEITAGASPYDADWVNLSWIYGLINLIAI